MDTSEAAEPSPADKTGEARQKYLSARQAAFIGSGRWWARASSRCWGILVLGLALDYGWKRGRPSSPVPVQVGS